MKVDTSEPLPHNYIPAEVEAIAEAKLESVFQLLDRLAEITEYEVRGDKILPKERRKEFIRLLLEIRRQYRSYKRYVESSKDRTYDTTGGYIVSLGRAAARSYLAQRADDSA